MSRFVPGRGWLFLGLLVIGCSKPASGPATSSDEDAVRAAFAELQKALKDRDAEKIWNILDDQSRKDADEAAAQWKKKYADADAAKVKKALGITREELDSLTGKSFLKTDAFFEKEIMELSESTKIEAVKIEKDQATVDYKDPEGGTDHITFFHTKGKWRARVSMETPK